ncbi:hypothetical protein [Pedobacter punctiformis]|uniref:DUF4294 domain-containing protein n=1 Tax=Pedobacter punctiformis TaxID=3004097 RepID=A0ABT4LBJ7_9SPHI|nr:hypothetical protein [Pedobacter sp. HCMS5-2]MCZ4245302.1 hypothetical protein [Pedobacter sp. HCMS5-2]
MTKHSTILTLIFGFIFFVSWGQNPKPTPADRFLNFLNNYQIDSLRVIVADNFELQRTYTKYINDKKSFLENYVPQSKVFNGKYKILKRAENKYETEYNVQDQSNYLKYLKITYPKWKIKILTNHKNMIEHMLIDTTGNYQLYLTQLKQKTKKFEKWVSQKHPTEYLKDIYANERRLTTLLKEYSMNK